MTGPEREDFAALLGRLDEVVPMGALQRLAAEQLRRSYRGDDLRDALVAMLARSDKEQDALRRIFEVPVPRAATPGAALRRWRYRILLVVLALCMVPVAPVWRAPQAVQQTIVEPTKAETDKPAEVQRQVHITKVKDAQRQRTTQRTPMPLPLPWLASLSLASLLLIALGLRWLRLPAAVLAARPQQQQQRRAEIRARHRQVIAAGRARKTPLVLYHVRATPPFTAAEREDLATLFGGLRRVEAGHDLDVPATLLATLDRGNHPTPRFQPLRRHRELLVLYDREHLDDYPDLSPFLRLLDDWKLRGLHVERYGFHHHPDRLLPERGGPSLPLADLGRRHPHAVLLLFSRRHRVDARDQRSWLPLVADFELRAWIDPDPRPHRSTRQERHVLDGLKAAGLLRFPFTVPGLMALARHLGEGGLGAGPPPWPPFSPPRELTGPLRLWAAAAALVPEASWDQLEVFRRDLPDLADNFPDRRDVHRLLWALGGPGAAEASDGRTLQLSPEQVQQHTAWLMDHRPDVARQVAAILEEQLGQVPPGTEAADPYAFWMWSLKVAFLRTLRDREARHLLEMIDSPFGEDVQDRMVRELGGAVLPEGEKRQLLPYVGGRDGIPWRDLLLGHRRLWLLALAGAVVGVATFGVGHRWLPGPLQAVVVVRPAVFRVEQRRREAATAARPEMIEVLPGRFQMGSPKEEVGRFDDEPQHKVRITRPYYLSATEVTQGQYQAVMKKNPSRFKGDDTRPVEGVSFYDAIDYCNALSQSEGMASCYVRKADAVTWAKDCRGYRLPTEAEWEYAARADQPTLYSGADDPEKVAWFDKNSDNTTHPVGKKTANAWGFHDMSGNVYEWVWDWHAADYGKTNDEEVGPIGPTAGPGRVFRGGSCWLEARYVRAAYRLWNSPGLAYDDLGFRVARSLP